MALGSDGYMMVYRSDGDYATRIKVMPLDYKRVLQEMSRAQAVDAVAS